MNISNEVRVGLLFLSGLVLLVLTIVSLNHWGQGRNTYAFAIRFQQAQGIQPGAMVRVAGVEVGRVSTIVLDPVSNEPLVIARVERGVHLYQNYRYSIGVGGIVGDRFIEIIPTTINPGSLVMANDKVDGYTSPDINEIFASANTLVSKLIVTIDSLNATVLDTGNQESLRETLKNIRRTSENTASLTGALAQTMTRNQTMVDSMVHDLTGISKDVRLMSDSLMPQLTNTRVLKNFEIVAERAASISQRLDRMSQTMESVVSDKELLASVKDSALHIKQATIDLEGLMADTRSSLKAIPTISQHIEAMTNDLPAMSKNMRAMTDDLPVISKNVRTMTDDFPAIINNVHTMTNDLPAITKSFKDVAPKTAENIAVISQNLRSASNDLAAIAHRVSGASSMMDTTQCEIEARVTGGIAHIRSEKSAFRSDVNLNVRGTSSMLRTGMADVGQKNAFNLQYGNRLDKKTWLRYGVVQSQAGVGVDYLMNPDCRLSGELFDPNQLRANALADFRIKPFGTGWWVTTGAYNLFDNPTWALGITYRQ